MFLRYDTRNDIDDTLNNNLNSKLPNNVKFLTEGSGANTKYYVQLGADSASKKLLGSNNKKYSRVVAEVTAYKLYDSVGILNGSVTVYDNENNVICRQAFPPGREFLSGQERV